MRNLFLLIIISIISFGVSFSQTTVDFDTDENWVADGATALTSYANHGYQGPGVLFQGTNVLRQSSAEQDGFPAFLGTYSFRLKNEATAELLITVETGGVSSFSFDVRRWDGNPMPDWTVEYSVDDALTWESLANINGTLLTTSDWFSYEANINSAVDNIKIRIKNTGTTERIMLDNFYWLPGGTDPILSITAPANNLVVNLDEVEVSFSTLNFELVTDGSLEYTLNGGTASYVTASPFTISSLIEGENTIVFQLVDDANQALDPAVTVTRTVNYVIPSTDPLISITSPANAANIYSTDVNIVFSLENFDLGTEGKIAYTINGGAVNYHTVSTPIELTGLDYQEHTVVLELVSMSDVSLTPAVTDQVTFTCLESQWLNNGSFELWEAGLPLGWFGSKSNILASAVNEYTTSAQDGLKACQLVNETTTHKRFATAQMNVTENTEYEITFWARGHGEIRTGLFDNRATGSGYAPYNEYIAVNSTDWTQYSQTITAITSVDIAEFIFSVVNTNADLEHIQIDNVSITEALQMPELTVTAPVNETIVNVNEVDVVFSVNNFILGTDGSLEYVLNGGTAQYQTASPFTITGLSEGENTIVFQLVDDTNIALDPIVTITRTVNYELPSTEPSLTITSPTNESSIFSTDVSIAFEVENFDLGTEGKIAYTINGGAVNYHTVVTPIELSGLDYQEHTVVLELVSMSDISLDPAVTDQVTFTCLEAQWLNNGSFELWDAGLPVSWYGVKSNIAAADVVEYTGSAQDGAKACQLINATTTHKRFTTQQLAVTESTEYDITFWVRGNGEIRTAIFDERAGTGYSPYNEYIIVNSTDWTQYTQSITAATNSSNAEFVFSVVNTNADLEHIQIDNVSITEALQMPELTVTAPVNEVTVNESQVDLVFSVSNFVLGTDGKFEYKLNGGTANYATESPVTVTGLIEGENTIAMQLVDMDDIALDPAVTALRTVYYEIPSTDPGLVIVSPANNATIYSQDVNISFNLSNFDLGVEGKIAYTIDEEEVVYLLTDAPIALTGLALGLHTVELELVTMSNQALATPVVATVNFTCAEALPGGMEPFDNSTATASYADGSFVGNNDIVWNYTHSRDEGDYSINGKGLMLRRGLDSKLESATIAGGISSFEVKMKKAFTGATVRQVELYINGELKGTSQEFGAGTGDDPNVYTFTVDNINVPGDFVMMIKPVSETDINRQVVLDDISWTGFMTTDPYLSITSPANNSTINNTDVNINFVVYNFDLGVDGKVRYAIDGGTDIYTTQSPVELTGLSDGLYTVEMELVDMAEASLSPAVTTTVSFTINTAAPEYTSIYDIQYTTDVSGNSPLIDQTVTTKGVVSATWGDKFWLQDGEGAWNSVYVFYTTSPGPAIGDSVVVEGKIVEYFELTEISPVYSLNIISNDGVVANPTTATTGGVSNEMYESCLVTVTGICTDPSAPYGMWIINDGSGTINIDDDIFDYTPVAGNSYTVTGILYYSYGEWKILPRIAADVIDNGVSTAPLLIITSPSNNETIFYDNLNLTFTVSNFNLGVDGKVAWSVDGGAVSYVTASPITITGLSEGAHTINLSLVDMADNPTSPVVSAMVNITVNLQGPTYTDIYDIQYTTNANGNSPLNGQQVWVRAVVSANFNGSQFGEGYYLQQGGGAWRGIYVNDLVNAPSIGDSVVVAGTVGENFNMTEIRNVSSYSIVGVDGIVAPALVVTTLDASTEQYESCLIKVENAECTIAQNQYGEWTVNDGSGDLKCKDNGVFDFEENVGYRYNVTGVMNYAYSAFSLHYRRASDISLASNIDAEFSSKISVYPNPASDFVIVEIGENVEKITVSNLMGQILAEFTQVNDNVRIDTKQFVSGLYFITVSNNNQNAVFKLMVE